MKNDRPMPTKLPSDDDSRVVLSLSGGKDSVATGLLLKELGIPFSCIFMDTGWEHRSLYNYIDMLQETEILGPITVLQARAADRNQKQPSSRWPSPSARPWPSSWRAAGPGEPVKSPDTLCWAACLPPQTSCVGTMAAGRLWPETAPLHRSYWTCTAQPTSRCSQTVPAASSRDACPP